MLTTINSIIPCRNTFSRNDNPSFKGIQQELNILYSGIVGKDPKYVIRHLSRIEEIVKSNPHKIPEALLKIYPLLDSEIQDNGTYIVRISAAHAIGNIAKGADNLTKTTAKAQLEARKSANHNNHGVISAIEQALQKLNT